MLAGRRIYEGKTVSEVLAAVLMKQPDLSKVPPEVRKLLRQCLEKDPKKRLRDIGDFEFLLAGREPAPPAVRGVPWFGLLGWSAAAVLLGAWLHTRSRVIEGPSVALTIVPAADTRLMQVGSHMSVPQISPDGSAVLYAANGGLYVRRLDSFHATKVPGSETSINEPFWSPDSGSVFYADTSVGGLMKVRVPDGAPEMVMPLPGPTRGGTADGKGTILVSGIFGNGPYLLAEPGGKTETLTVPGLAKGEIWYPEFLPAGDAVLFLSLPADGASSEICLASFKAGTLVDPIPLLKNDTAARYTPAGGGRILFVRNDNLYSQRLDLGQRKLVGDSHLIAEHVGFGPGMRVDRADFSVSRSGVLAWRPGSAALSQVTMFDRKGSVIGTSGPSSPVSSLKLSPDETRLLAWESASGFSMLVNRVDSIWERRFDGCFGLRTDQNLSVGTREGLWSVRSAGRAKFANWAKGKDICRTCRRTGSSFSP